MDNNTTTTAAATGTEEIQIDLMDTPKEKAPLDIDLDLGNSNPRETGISENEIDNEKTDIANPRETGISNEPVMTLAIELGVDLSGDNQELMQAAAIDMGKAATLLVRSGLRLLTAKENCQHGEFEGYLSRIGISSQRASDSMRYATFASLIPINQLDKYLMLPKRAALILGNAEPDVIEALLEDDHYEDARRLTNKAQLQQLLQDLNESKDERERYQKENQELHAQIKAMEEAQEAHIAGSEYPLDVVTLRKESSVLADEAIASLSSIRTYVERYDASNAPAETQERKRHDEAALYPALANVGSIINSAHQLFKDICDAHDINAQDIPAHAMIEFPENELAMIEVAREGMLARKEGKAIARQTAYGESGDVKRPKGRQRKPA